MLHRLKAWVRPLAVDRVARVLVLVSVALNVLSWLAIVIRLAPLIASGKIIALHYSIYTGVSAVGPAWQAFVLPVLGTGIVIANACLARVAYTRQSRGVALTLLALTLFLEALALVGSAYLILINLTI